MGYRDTRQWLNTLEKEGELKVIDVRVSLDEIPIIIRKVFNMKSGGPAVLFKNIDGYQTKKCQKLFVGGLSSFKRIALMLGLPKNTIYQELVDEVRRRFRNPISPVRSATGSTKENIINGKDINLFDFPVPKWHPLDGGRYINTFCAVVTKDPENGTINAGLYRGQIQDKDTIGVLLTGTSHWGIHYRKYQQVGKDMPVAVVYGWDPSMVFVASCPVLKPEYEMIGAIRQEPVPLVECNTSDLLVPSEAEIILEGHVPVNKGTYLEEGPFGEYTGYYGEKRKRPVIKVDCITHKNDPIYRGTLEGMKPGYRNEDSFMYAVSLSALTKNILEDQGIPGIMDVYASTTTYVKIKKFYRGHAKQIAAALWGCGAAQYLFKNVVVVDDDIDIHNLRSLEWALSYRFNPAEGDLLLYPGTPGGHLDPSVPFDDRDEVKYGAGVWCRLLIDATKTWRYGSRSEWENNAYPPDSLKQESDVVTTVEKRWKEFNF